ncbi:hypothetical protein NQ152_03850 [Microbacterium sp. zg.B48]|uniref:hypothetical protein n=1 Tax=Microbacterium sp. zg.B48 TaxID=2969408 RepID=UPI00214CAA62|nr:hypothetical protein [Microbacterium sp. zg.B48]MCR2762637.1 hypothetical protein [Microbacterium sp. zg.B48]
MKGLTRTVALLAEIALDPLSVRLRAPSEPVTATQVGFMTAAMLIGGTLLSILTTPDPMWWQLHFSRLGTFSVFSGHLFNATLIAAGGGVVLFGWRLRIEMKRHAGTSVLVSRRSATAVPILVVLIGIHLSFVGVIPQNTNEFLHDRASTGAVFSFTAILLSSRWLLRGMHRGVTRATRQVGVGLVVAVSVYIAGFINLAAFELVGFSLIFFWLLFFARNLGRGADAAPPAPAVQRTASTHTVPLPARARARRIRAAASGPSSAAARPRTVARPRATARARRSMSRAFTSRQPDPEHHRARSWRPPVDRR